MHNNQHLQLKCLSSLAKVFADEELRDMELERASAFHNEAYSFQVAYKADHLIKDVSIHIESDLEEAVSLYTIGLVPSEFPTYPEHDEYILRSTPGLYPDPLFPFSRTDKLLVPANQWRSIWVSVAISEQIQGGVHPIRLALLSAEGESLGQVEFHLEIIPASLPPQKLIHTEWLHADCLALHYNVDIFSEEHWSIIDQYVKTAVDHGMNMLLTPLFTQSTDLVTGKYRPTVQLVDIEKTGNQYRFSFDRLTRWVEMARNRGIQYFEFTHLYTQWGAKHPPKIVAVEDGELRRIFGWDTDAHGEDYKQFLTQFLPCLFEYLHEHELDKCVYFHISDEPKMHNLDSYRKSSEFVAPLLKDYPIIDALRDYEFYELGLIKTPVTATNFIEPFLDNQVPGLWAYYCCSQYSEVSNRFFNMPSLQNRIIGMQLFKYDISGFLHWGYNFWYEDLSKKLIDPFKVTDGVFRYPSGDAFVVYPGEHGPILSLRLKVFYEGLQDLRALEWLESLAGKEEAVQIIEDGLEESLTFSRYPRSAQWLIQKRETINNAIKQYLQAAE